MTDFGFPVNLAVRGRRCVIVGGGDEAVPRVRRLRHAAADTHVVTPAPCRELESLVGGPVTLHRRAWVEADLTGAVLVVATREDPLDEGALYAAGQRSGALVSVLDDLDHCDFAAMSAVERGDFHLSIATNGRAPALAKAARKRLESVFDDAWGELTETIHRARQQLLPRTLPFDEWARRWQLALDDVDGLLDRLRAGDHGGVEAHLRQVVGEGTVATCRAAHPAGSARSHVHAVPEPAARATPTTHATDTRPHRTARPARSGDAARPDADAVPVVHLVGAGPGDPELLTVRAARLLAAADLVVHDQLVPPAVLAEVGDGAELVAAGRRCGNVVLAHPAVVDRLAEGARAGRRVVRLKGGDPVVFGRGGEETLELAARGVATELVPGISSAVAAPELAGIPLTHRGLSSGFLVLTGRRRRDDDRLGPDWDLAARFSGTVVVLMGGERLGDLAAALVERGRAAATPAAVVAHAGRPEQAIVRGRLDDIATRAADLGTPAVLVVGDVVDVLAAVDASIAAASPSVPTSLSG